MAEKIEALHTMQVGGAFLFSTFPRGGRRRSVIDARRRFYLSVLWLFSPLHNRATSVTTGDVIEWW